MKLNEAIDKAILDVLEEKNIVYTPYESEPPQLMLNDQEFCDFKERVIQTISNWYDQGLLELIDSSKSTMNERRKVFLSGALRRRLRRCTKYLQGISPNSSEFFRLEKKIDEKRFGKEIAEKIEVLRMKGIREKFKKFENSNPIENIFNPEKRLGLALSDWSAIQHLVSNYYTLKTELETWEKHGIDTGGYLFEVQNMIDFFEDRLREVDRNDQEVLDRQNEIVAAVEGLKELQNNANEGFRENKGYLSKISKNIDELNERHRQAFWNNQDYIFKGNK